MARIRLPEGTGSDRERMWTLRPELGVAVGTLSQAVYERSTLPVRVAELVRYRIARINDCPN